MNVDESKIYVSFYEEDEMFHSKMGEINCANWEDDVKVHYNRELEKLCISIKTEDILNIRQKNELTKIMVEIKEDDMAIFDTIKDIDDIHFNEFTHNYELQLIISETTFDFLTVDIEQHQYYLERV